MPVSTIIRVILDGYYEGGLPVLDLGCLEALAACAATLADALRDELALKRMRYAIWLVPVHNASIAVRRMAMLVVGCGDYFPYAIGSAGSIVQQQANIAEGRVYASNVAIHALLSSIDGSDCSAYTVPFPIFFRMTSIAARILSSACGSCSMPISSENQSPNLKTVVTAGHSTQ